LTLDSPKLKERLVIPSELQWARPNPAGAWLLGCGFEPALTDEAFDGLLQSGLLERRSSVRRRTRIAVDAQWRAKGARVPALVCDLSEGGLCLTTVQAPDNRHNVSIVGTLRGDEVRIPLHVRWSMHVGPNYFVGCEFVHSDDFAVVRKMQPAVDNHLRMRTGAAMIQAECP
jgi:hypothetical protein